MILDLLKFGLLFFLPSIISRAFKLYRSLSQKNFSILSWKKQKLSHKFSNIVVIIFIVLKLKSLFLSGSENFFSLTHSRIDSPSYIIRNNFRDYIQRWSEADPLVRKIIESPETLLEDSQYSGKPSFKRFVDLKKLSEALKIKEKKIFYVKYGEAAFLNCDYCTADYDYLMFIFPSILIEYCMFLIIAGILSLSYFKSKWRNYSIILVILLFGAETYAFMVQPFSPTTFEPYDVLFGDDLFTLRFEKLSFFRNASFLVFLIFSLIFDYGKDNSLEAALDQLRSSTETSLSFLQATRIHDAVLSIDENLKKFSNEMKKTPSELATIISSPGFRQKVAESGHKLDVETLLLKKDEDFDKLMKISRK